MTINKQAFYIAGVTYEQYVEWCNETHRRINDNQSKKEFFKRIREGKLSMTVTDKLVSTRKRRK